MPKKPELDCRPQIVQKPPYVFGDSVTFKSDVTGIMVLGTVKGKRLFGGEVILRVKLWDPLYSNPEYVEVLEKHVRSTGC